MIRNKKKTKRLLSYLKNLSLIKKGIIIGFVIPLVWNLIDLTTFLEVSDIHIFEGYHLFFTLLFQSMTASILGGSIGLFFQKFNNKKINQKEELFLTILLVFLFKIIFLEKDYFGVFFVFLILTCIIYLIRIKINQRRIKTSILISYILLITFLLGVFAVYPFGEKIYERSGDVVLVTINFMSIVSYPLYFLTFLGINLIRLANITMINFFQFFGVLLLLYLYYFLLSSILVLIVELICKIFKLAGVKR